MNELSLSDLIKIVKDHESRLTSLEQLVQKGTDQEKKLIGHNLEMLSQQAGISIEKLNELFDFESEKLTILKLKGKDTKDKTLNLSLIVLFAYKYYFGKDDLKTQELRRNAQENGLSVGHFGDYLNELIPMYIRRIGKARSVSILYRITGPGETKAKELFKEM